MPGEKDGESSGSPSADRATMRIPAALGDEESISLCETLDRVLNKGVAAVGEVVISVADVDLIYLGLQLVLTSVETAKANILERELTTASTTAQGRSF